MAAVGLLAVATAGGLFLPPTAGAAGRSGVAAERYPTELWQAFPLGRRPTSSAAAAAGSAAPALIARADRRARPGPFHGLLPHALVTAWLLAAVLLFGLLLGPLRHWHAVVRLLLASPAFRSARRCRATCGYMLAVPSPGGGGQVRVVACGGEPPQLGEVIQDAQLAPGQFVVVLVGRSPFPGDERPCAFLLAV